MCGIVGMLHHGRGDAVDAAALAEMNATLRHRGPDDSGEYANGVVGMAMRRLSIIDIAAGHQPMSSADRRLWITFNGEIYNFQELREELIRKGRSFRTRSDTEVLLHLYEEMGDAFLTRLRGMFAFALWDGRRKRLLLARDRMGKKPLLYSSEGGRLLWASEMQALLAAPGLSQEIDPEAVDLFLALQYIPSPRTIFRSVRKLPPAHFLVCERGEIRVQRYWDVPSQPLDIGFEEARQTVRAKLKEATRLRMISDVPIGAFLSGGIDSSCVVAMMSELSDRPVRTFAAGFQEEDFSELKHAREVAHRFGTRHTEIVVRPRMADILPTLARHYGEPFGDSSALPTFFIAQETRRHVSVALTGDGGDESFAGYNRYRPLRLLEFQESWRWQTRAHGAIAAAAAHWPVRLDNKSYFYRLLKRLPAVVPTRVFDRYLVQMEIFGEAQRHALYTDAFRRLLPGPSASAAYLRPLFDQAGSRDIINQLLQVDLRSYLPECLMTKVDIASMANSLETRSPFLDHEVVEFASGLSATWKLKPPAGHKWLLKEAFRDVLPPSLMDRPKMGFSIPVDAWFRGDLMRVFRDYVFSPAALARRYFKVDALERLFGAHVSGNADHGNQLWSLLMLEVWHRHVAPRATLAAEEPAGIA